MVRIKSFDCGMEVVRPDGLDPSINCNIRRVFVAAGSSSLAKFPIRFNTLGEFSIFVHAYADDDGPVVIIPAIEKQIFVQVSSVAVVVVIVF